MTRRIRFVVEGVGWLSVAAVGLAVLMEARPSIGCRLLGHSPTRYSWLSAAEEEASCRDCGERLVRVRRDGAIAA